MTVVAWDGKTLAADRRAITGGGICRPVTKIWRAYEGTESSALLAATGSWDVGMELREWWKSGSNPTTFPTEAREKNGDAPATLIVITRYGLFSYCTGPYPMQVEAEQCAWGSGRDFAEAAMYVGKTAYEAVAVACVFQSDCGNGIDILERDW